MTQADDKHVSHIAGLVNRIDSVCGRLDTVRIMEVCGTHTVSLFRSGVRSLLPPGCRLISGPGCPVCVTAQGYLDAACLLADRNGVTVCTYGDLVRVPGENGSLEQQRSGGGDVTVVYSVRDALSLARNNPATEVVFLAVGFETTAPATAAAVMEARERGIGNFTILPGHKLVVPAMLTLLRDPKVAIDAFLCPGHVSVVIGTNAYRPVAEKFGKPCAVAGFEPGAMLEAILCLLRQLDDGVARVDNAYGVAVRDDGNPKARELMARVFSPAHAVWRAMGTIPNSGLALNSEFREFDAAARFGVDTERDAAPPDCRCGEVIQGRCEPPECPLFGSTCTPLEPVGPCMVSSEGTCAAWYKYNRGNAAGHPGELPCR